MSILMGGLFRSHYLIHSFPSTMKFMIKTFLLSAGFLTLTAGLWAQSFEFISVSKSVRNVQTDASTVIPDPAPVSEWNGGPYSFEVNVQGTDLSGITPPVVSGPISVGEPFFNGGVLVYDSEDGEWGFGSPHADGYDATSQSAIDSLFGNGVYTLVVNGVTLSLDLSPESFAAAPVLTLSGGEWIDGKYYLPYNSELTVTTSVFSAYGTHEEDAVWFSIWGQNTEYEMEDLNLASQAPTADSYSTTIPANTFTAGKTYEIEAGFFAAPDFQTHASFPDSMILAGFEVSTGVELVVTPLPDPQPVTTRIDTAVVVKFYTEWGGTYRIEGSFDMENWFQAHSDIDADGSEQTLFFERVSPSQFYRVTRIF